MEETNASVDTPQAPQAPAAVQEPAASEAVPTPTPTTVETAQAPAAAPEVAEAPTAPAAESAPKKEEPAPAAAPTAHDKGKVKINVSKTTKEGGFKPGDIKAKKAWIAERHKENQQILLKAGYSTTTVVDIMRYLTTSKPYEDKGGKDHLILMFDRLARSLRYKMPRFDKGLSSQIAIVFIDLHDRLIKTEDLFNRPAKESMTYVRKQIKSAWRENIGEDYSKELEQIVESCFNMTIPEGYAQRAMYFIECVSDILLKLSDPFEGHFHDEPMEMPDDMKRKPKKHVFPPKMCPKCGKEMKWVFALKKHVCMNPVCEDYRPPRPKEPCPKCGKPMKWIESIQKFICINHDCEDYRPPRKKRMDGDQHRGNGPKGGKWKQRPAPDRTWASSGPVEVKKDSDGKEIEVKKEFKNNAFGALDGLKIGQ